ncbi:hypothetical protein RirG_006000 [Rhizophagus irregularis DAOM 197198w]|uniref:Uncharacterized protein n=1 Tax=Rhizophagus irregularis (strain DAOM 197198w) TaxID=1432141 RepID=A0A015KC78_RHIIW|nr:hypothetical protein RirG_006000 [Rhizophagus irregularis DAOM 197198w]
MAPPRIERLRACQSLSNERAESEDIEGWCVVKYNSRREFTSLENVSQISSFKFL